MENGNAPATKQDIQKVEQKIEKIEQKIEKIEQNIEKVEQRIEMIQSEFHHGFDDLKEAMRDGQTELLKAFYSYTRSSDQRADEGEAESAALKKRISIVESRITEVERRLNTPPPA